MENIISKHFDIVIKENIDIKVAKNDWRFRQTLILYTSEQWNLFEWWLITINFSPFIIIQYHLTIFSKIGLHIWKLWWVQNEWRLDINLETVFIAVFIHHWMKVKYCLEFRWSKMLQIQRHVKASGINSKGEQWFLLLILLWKLKHMVRSFLEMGVQTPLSNNVYK